MLHILLAQLMNANRSTHAAGMIWPNIRLAYELCILYAVYLSEPFCCFYTELNFICMLSILYVLIMQSLHSVWPDGLCNIDVLHSVSKTSREMHIGC
jgi:hypothetical protein